MIGAHLPALQVVVPLFGALLAALFRRPAAAWLIATAVSIACLAISVLLLQQVLASGPVSYRIGGWDPALGIEYRIDLLNGLVLALVSAMAVVVAPFARRSVASELPTDRVAWFYTMYLLALTGLLGIAVTGDAFNAFVFLEISSLSSYVLIALGRNRRALVAAYQYLILGTIGATFYVVGVGLLYLSVGTLNLGLMAGRLADLGATRPVIAALAFITVGISLKLALFPLHVWLPNAYAFAPSAATVFLAATATKVAIYLFIRFLFSIFGTPLVFGERPMTVILTVLSVAAIFGAGAVALFQSDVKRMFAYSSVAQIGYVTLGIALATVTGLTGALVHVLNHAMLKGALFMALGAIVYRVGGSDVGDLAGVGRRMPWTFAVFAIAGLGLVGVPGTSGFVSKWYLVVAAFEVGWWWLGFLIVASSLLTLAYVARVLDVAVFRRPRATTAAAVEAPADMLAPMLALAAAVIFFGLDTDLTAGIAGRAAVMLLGASP